MDVMERHIYAVVLEAVEAVRNHTPRADVARALQAGDVSGAVDAIRWEAATAVLERRIPTAIRTAIEQTAHPEGDRLAGRRVRTKATASAISGFDVYNSEVVAWARQHAAELIEEFGRSSMRAIRRLIVENVAGTITARDLVNLIVDSGIGLTERQAIAIQNRRQMLQETTTLTDAQIEARLRRYAQKLLRQRAKTIARTEVARARMFGKLSSWRQSGLEATKAWSAHATACDECQDLNGEEVGLEETFSNGEDSPPAHPNCQCGMTIRSEPDL